MQPKLIIAFKDPGNPAFPTRAEGISKALTGNTHFPEPWPAPLPSSAQLAADVAAYQSAHIAARPGDKQKIALRDAARAVVTAELKRLALYLEMVADGDVAALMSTGYDLRHATVKASGANPDILPAAEDFRVSRGVLSGTITLHARKLAGAGAYEVQTTVADPTQEPGWVGGGVFTRCSKIELSGLAPGAVVSARLRGIGSHSPVAWPVVASLRVV
jgi:hypothetical protein